MPALSAIAVHLQPLSIVRLLEWAELQCARADAIHASVCMARSEYLTYTSSAWGGSSLVQGKLRTVPTPCLLGKSAVPEMTDLKVTEEVSVP